MTSPDRSSESHVREQLREALEKATPGPWRTADLSRFLIVAGDKTPDRHLASVQTTHDAELICLLRNHADLLLAALSSPQGAPVCAICGKPAECFGEYETCEGQIDLACGSCCRHGNEDGWCKPLSGLFDYARDLSRTVHETTSSPQGARPTWQPIENFSADEPLIMFTPPGRLMSDYRISTRRHWTWATLALPLSVLPDPTIPAPSSAPPPAEEK